MLNFKAIVRTIARKKCVDEDTAWSAVAEAYIRLDLTRPIPQQASYLMKAGCFFCYDHEKREEVAIEGLEEVLPSTHGFDEESFIKALGTDARQVADEIMNGRMKLVTVESVRWNLKTNNRNYSRKRAREVINELQRNYKRELGRTSEKDSSGESCRVRCETPD